MKRVLLWAVAIIFVLGSLPAICADGPQQPQSVKVAGLVLRWVRGDKEANVRRLEPMIREAAAKGAKIVVTTECSLDGYAVAERKNLSDADWRALGEPIPSGAYFKKLAALAKELKIYLIAGMTEADGDQRYNTVVIIGPDGTLVGKYRKQNLGHEAGRNTPGTQSSVFATPFGKIGVMICADRTDAKIVQRFCANGADFLICPSGGMFGPKSNDPIVQARSKENKIHIVFVHPVEFLATGPDGGILRRELVGTNLLVTKEQVDGKEDERRIYYFEMPMKAPQADTAPQPKLRATIGAGHSASVTSVAFSPDFKTFASASGDTTVKLWDVATGKELATLEGHKFPVSEVAFSPDGKNLYSAGYGSDTRLWDVATRKPLAANEATMAAAAGWKWQKRRTTFNYTTADMTVPPLSGKFALSLHSPDGKTIATVESIDANHWKQLLKFWHAATGKLLAAPPSNNGYVHSLEFSADGKTLAASGDTMVTLWDLATGKTVNTVVLARLWGINSLAFSGDGHSLGAASWSEVHVWNVHTGKNLASLRTDWFAYAHAMSLGAQANTIALGGRYLSIWDVATGQKTATLAEASDSLSGFCVAISHDGKTLAAGCDQGAPLTLWNIVQRKKIMTLSGLSTHSVAFDRDDKILASAHANGSVKLWDVGTGNNMATYNFNNQPVSSVAFSPDGKMLVSASGATVQIWDLLRGRNITTLKGHEWRVNSVAIHPNGKWLASGSSDGTVRLWDVATGKNFATMPEHRYHVNCVAFSPDGKTLASGGSDGTIRFWDLP